MAIYYTGYTITGDCSATSQGIFNLYFESTEPPTVFTWVNVPQSYSATTGYTFTSYTNTIILTGLSVGNYIFNFYDKSPLSEVVEFQITSSSTVSLSAGTNTSCGQNNGLIVSTTNQYYGGYLNLYNQNGFVTSAITSNNAPLLGESQLQEIPPGPTNLFFTNLEPGVYYANTVETFGCNSSSNTVVIHESSELNFGLYVVNSSNCVSNNGKIFVTGLTGTPPYTYQWFGDLNQTFTGDSVTGLTTGGYQVVITDYFGCSKSLSAVVQQSGALNLVSYVATPPTCFNNDGSIVFYFSGGSAPYYYYLSNGFTQTILSNQVEFTGLTSGNYTITVTDSGLCNYSTQVILAAPSSFYSINTKVVDSDCTTSGSISISFKGGTPPFTAVLSGQNYTTNTVTNTNNAFTFNGLQNNTYNLQITDSIGNCTYSEDYTVGLLTNIEFELTATATTCNSANGAITVQVTNSQSGETYTYSLNDGDVSSSTTATTYTFNNLTSGIYSVVVTNSNYCSYSKIIYVKPSNEINLSLYSTSCGNGSDGTISAMIQNTDGPYELIWSSNISGQTGVFVSGLSAGNYSLFVSGSNGCFAAKDITISCNPPLSATNYSFKYSDGTNVSNNKNKFNLTNMLYSGFTELTLNSQNCSLSSATFYFKITLDSVDYQYPFYYTKSFSNIPDMSYFAGIIEDTVESIPNIVSCTVNSDNNSIDIVAKSDGGVEYYKNETIQFSVMIDYIINCVSTNSVVC
jgi:hypothetical protein